MKKEMQGSDYMARLFKNFGVSHVFYMEAILRMALREMENLGIKTVSAHSENAAGYMADGYARASGRVGVCMCQSVGAGNMAGGITDAYMACSPVMAITGKKLPDLQFKNSYQYYDHCFLYTVLTKYHGVAVDAGETPEILAQAFRAATAGKSRPVHVDVYQNLGRATETAQMEGEIEIDSRYGKIPPNRIPAEEALIDRALELIEKSKKPCIMAGRGASYSRAGEELYLLAQKLDIPVVTTPDGKSLISEEGRYWAGVNGDYGMDCANRTLMESDLVIIIGSQANDQSTCNWRCPSKYTDIIQIDIEPSELGRNYPNTLGLAGDAKTVLRQLIDKSAPKIRDKWMEQVAAYVKETLEEYRKAQMSDSTPIMQERLCEEISRALPDDAVLVSDTGYAAVWTSSMVRMKSTQNYYRAAGSLGWALPGAMGVKCALSDRPVVAFIGDGGMYYHLSELETAVRNNINVVFVVNNNGIFAQCSGDIKNVYKDEPKRGEKHFTFVKTNFTNIAGEMGCYAKRVTSPGDIAPSIREAIKADRPAVIEVMTLPHSGRPAALKPRNNCRGKEETLD